MCNSKPSFYVCIFVRLHICTSLFQQKKDMVAKTFMYFRPVAAKKFVDDGIKTIEGDVLWKMCAVKGHMHACQIF